MRHICSQCLFLLLGGVMSLPPNVQAAWLGGFACRRQIIIHSSVIDADLTNFPVLVRLTTNNFHFARAMTNGFDLRFTAADTTTLLSYERERHDAVAETAEYWVKVPLINSNADTVIYLYYDNSGANDGADPTNVWDADFDAVWHKNDLTDTTIADSTVNGYIGDKRTNDAPGETEGKIGLAQLYNGALTNYIDTGYDRDLSGAGDFTASAWVKYSGSISYAVGQSHALPPSTFASDWFFPWGNTSIFWMRSKTLGSVATINNGLWHYLALAWDQSAAQYVGYVDGNSIGTSAVVAGYGGVGSVKLGARPDLTSTFYSGSVDEVRISLVARPAAWVKAEYHAGNDSLLTVGIEQSVPHCGLIILVR